MQHDYRTCTIKDCIECLELIEYGIIMACDECDLPGDADADSWHLMDDGRTLCSNCYNKGIEF